MKPKIAKCSLVERPGAVALLILLAVAGCGRDAARHPTATERPTVPSMETSRAITPLSLVLARHEGNSPTDEQIRHLQNLVRADRNRDAALERLGWLFVAKARESFDSGYYKVAEACADVLKSNSPGSAAELLLRGHVLQNLHHFKEAEPLARELVARRGLSFDYALLGDTLMEQGRLDEAVAAYQSMMDLRPDLHSYSRAAHVRWLKGDVEGATELMEVAASASSPQDPEAAAWVYTRLAAFQFQAGATNQAGRACADALMLRPNYPPARLLRGRMLLARGDAAGAVEELTRAAAANPLPEYQWTLTEALRSAGRAEEAAAVESRLRTHGAHTDPRTFSLYLATLGKETAAAVRLAKKEFQQRQDVFTHDALAWALAADGHLEEAREHIARALAAGTQDARLFFHAAVIASRAGQTQEAHDWLARAGKLTPMLLPCEREQLNHIAQLVGSPRDASPPGRVSANGRTRLSASGS
jgi:tetratricopeptide (TPR) repeat protein